MVDEKYISQIVESIRHNGDSSAEKPRYKFNSKKVKRIIISILMMLSPVFIMVCPIENDTIYTIITVFVGLCFFIA